PASRARRSLAAGPAVSRSWVPRDRRSAIGAIAHARLGRSTRRRRRAAGSASKLHGPRLELALPVGGQHQEECDARVGPCELVAVGALSYAYDTAGRRLAVAEGNSRHVEIDDRRLVTRVSDRLHLEPQRGRALGRRD